MVSAIINDNSTKRAFFEYLSRILNGHHIGFEILSNILFDESADMKRFFREFIDWYHALSGYGPPRWQVIYLCAKVGIFSELVQKSLEQLEKWSDPPKKRLA